MLHKNRILPCIKLDTKLLIKNNDEIPEIEYNKWFHYLVTIKNPEPVDNTEVESNNNMENFQSCVFSETVRPTTEEMETPDTPGINSNYEILSYLNGKETVTKFNTVLKFNEESQKLTIDGFDSYNQQREYANNTKLANLKIFNGILDKGTIYDLLKYEHKFYDDNEPELIFMDLNSKIMKKLDYNMTGKNCIMESFNKENLIIISDNKKITYDIKKGSDYDEDNQENKNVLDLINLTKSVVTIRHIENLLSFSYENKNLMPESETCPKGKFRSDGECKDCPVNTYSYTENMSYCKNCPENYTTNGQTGQSKCMPDEGFMNTKTKIILDENVTNYLKNSSQRYDRAMEGINELNTQVSNMEKNLELINKNIV